VRNDNNNKNNNKKMSSELESVKSQLQQFAHELERRYEAFGRELEVLYENQSVVIDQVAKLLSWSNKEPAELQIKVDALSHEFARFRHQSII